MLEYKTTGIIRVNGGYVGLNQKQADTRHRKVKATKNAGVYEVVAPIVFKAGETLKMDNPDKVALNHLVCLENSQPEKKPEKEPLATPTDPEKKPQQTKKPAVRKTGKKAAK